MTIKGKYVVATWVSVTDQEGTVVQGGFVADHDKLVSSLVKNQLTGFAQELCLN